MGRDSCESIVDIIAESTIAINIATNIVGKKSSQLLIPGGKQKLEEL